MIAQFSIYPTDDSHISADLGKVKTLLESSGLEFQIGPIGTCVRGEWEQVLDTIKKCHGLIKKDHERLVTSIVIDDRHHAEHTLSSAVDSVV